MRSPLTPPSSTLVTAAIIADEIRLRIYSGGEIKYEVPLRRRQALGLGAQLVQLGLLPEYPPEPDSFVLQSPGKDDIARKGSEHG